MSDISQAEAGITGRVAALDEEVRKAKILIVDDMDLTRKMIASSLAKGGFSNFQYAEDGDHALKVIAQDQPDLVILDLNMPKMSGYEVCKILRADPATQGLPILVQSASEAPEERVQVFASGATDFVSKPINKSELLARVSMHIENKFLIEDLSAFKSHIGDELLLARSMQKELLPQRAFLREIEVRGNLRIENYYRASFELGGDLWGCWRVGENRIGIYILDIVGHGVGAALNTFRIHATMARFQELRVDPALFMNQLNGELFETLPTGQFATMFYCVLDIDSGDITYAGAGAPRPLIIGVDHGVRMLDSDGVPIGIIKTPDYRNKTATLSKGETLMCYSDVLIETRDDVGEIMGQDGFAAHVSDISRRVERNILISNVLKEFFDVLKGDLPDDLTAVGFHRGSKDDTLLNPEVQSFLNQLHQNGDQ